MEKKRRFFWIKKSLMERDEAVIINQEESHGEYQTAGEAHAYQQLKDMQSREHAQQADCVEEAEKSARHREERKGHTEKRVALEAAKAKARPIILKARAATTAANEAQERYVKAEQRANIMREKGQTMQNQAHVAQKHAEESARRLRERRVDKKGMCAYHSHVRITKKGKIYGFTDKGEICGACKLEAESAQSEAEYAAGKAKQAEEEAQQAASNAQRTKGEAESAAAEAEGAQAEVKLTIMDLRKADYSAKDCNAAGYSAKDCDAAGYSAKEILALLSAIRAKLSTEEQERVDEQLFKAATHGEAEGVERLSYAGANPSFVSNNDYASFPSFSASFSAATASFLSSTTSSFSFSPSSSASI